MNLDKEQKTWLVIALGAVVVLVLGFSLLNTSDSDTSANANAQMPGPDPSGAGGDGMGQGGPPGGGPGGPGQMEEVTGSAATKAKEAAEAEVDGTAQRVMKNPQGSGYIVIVQTEEGTPTIVTVSAKFKVTESRAMQGPPGGGQGGPPQGSQPPSVEGTNTQ
ncbi:MAG: hypothetical protein HYX29_01600 [Solirubrobacterales bacterium]|nr:hypothetical protein [Solirubrobacterales bacterium]